jgi:hypothetical protein
MVGTNAYKILLGSLYLRDCLGDVGVDGIIFNWMFIRSVVKI